MIKKKDQKTVKKIQKQIAFLKEELKKIELRPCKGDADIKQKEEEIFMLKREIYDLEKDANQYAIFVSGIGSG